MFEQETYDVILKRMLDRVPDQMDKRESSLIWDTHSATAIELQIMYIELESMITNSYGDTASGEFLTMLCRDRGIIPKGATYAVLKGEFTPADIDVAGKRFNIGDINYVVTKQIAPGEYEVQCETAGMVGNQFLGQMIPMEYIDGLQSAVLAEVLIPGEDKETTEALRQRYLDSFNEKAFGGNRADYIDAVKSIDGIGDVKVTRVWNGDIRPADMIPTAAVTAWYESVVTSLDAEVGTWLSAVYMAAAEKKLTVGGTILITIVDADDFGEASDALVNLVQTELDPEPDAGDGVGLAPIGHVVHVKSANGVEIHVATKIDFDEGFSWLNLQSAITDAVSDYLLELRQGWSGGTYTVVRISQIESRILAVKGVADISDTCINGNAENLTLGQYDIPVIGGVSE